MGDRIEVGDAVEIKFATHPPIRGEVLYTPAATGDSWHVRTKDGMLVYVQQFDFMLQLEKGRR
jgi:hypothetical protein